MPQVDRLLGLIDRRPRIKDTRARHRGPATHVIILDGTMSSLASGAETIAGLTYKLLREMRTNANLTLYYEAGIQWRDWKGTLDVMMGRGINRQIERAYGVLASRYRPGDRIILIGYSRGAYAVRSLAGVVDHVGLVRADEATVRTIRTAYRHYRLGTRSKTVNVFRDLFCHPKVEIEAVGVWDTVKALGLRLPIIWRWAEAAHSFHNHRLGRHIRNGFHALALNETREAFAPVMWTTDPGNPSHVEQVWFRGTHGDIGGQLSGVTAARPLANIPLVWLLNRLETCGLPLPPDWPARFPQDATAPAVGSWLGWGKLFLSRRRRIVGTDPSERLHETVEIRGRWLQKIAGRSRVRSALPASEPATPPVQAIP